ncbi:hypothetical protein DW719_11750 [Ruminococcus sp. AM27-27]|uniref:restriction endonuclease subunit S n=1 Tax=Mediterraneibacter TaxID=2316020 RepID=UPI000E521FC9|nr:MULTISPECIES: restriction endonuclease subunit S [Mediterraneibacter]RGH91165.1 hypothetical protein DW719_11750 [Ruminococcus sp. AM27-27]
MKKTFDEVVLFARTGLNPRQNFKLGQGKNKYITIKNIKNNTLVVDDNTDVVDDDAIKLIHKRSQIKKGDILFASIGRMGDMYIIEKEPVGWDINESVFAFTLNTNIIRQKYFYYIFKVKSTLDYLASNSSGSTFKSIKMNQLKRMVFDIPSLKEQDSIITILDKVCNVIEMRKRELGSLDELIKARFVEMFGDMYLNSKGWSEAKLESMADVVSGITKGRKTKSEDLTEVPYMAVSNVKDGYIDWTTVKTIGATQQEIEQYRLLADDVLMTEGGDPDKVGRGAIIKEPLENCIHQNHIFRVRLDESVVLPEYFAEYLQHQRSKRYFLGCAKQTTGIASINMTQLRALPVLIPPLSKQEEFVLFKAEVDKSKVTKQIDSHIS